MLNNQNNVKYIGYVYLIEDDIKLSTSLSEILGFAGYYVYTFSDPQLFLDTFIDVSPAVVLTDVRMPNMSGVELQNKLKGSNRKLPFVFISGESSVSQTVEAFTLGAIAFLIKPFARESLLREIAKAIAIDTDRELALKISLTFEEKMSLLSPRERQVFGLLAQGYSNAELVDQLGIALSTIKEYKSELMYKLGIKSLSQLVALNATSMNAVKMFQK